MVTAIDARWLGPELSSNGLQTLSQQWVDLLNLSNALNSVEDSRMISPAELGTDMGERGARELSNEKHRYLTGSRYVTMSPRAFQVSRTHLKCLTDNADDVRSAHLM